MITMRYIHFILFANSLFTIVYSLHLVLSIEQRALYFSVFLQTLMNKYIRSHMEEKEKNTRLLVI
jgi:hypothetical protein